MADHADLRCGSGAVVRRDAPWGDGLAAFAGDRGASRQQVDSAWVAKERIVPRRYDMERRAKAAEETRRRIVASLLDLLVDRRPDQITLDEVADRAGVSLRTLYHHFASRAALLSAALQELAAEVGQHAIGAWAVDLAGPRDALRAYVTGIYEVYEAHRQGFDAILSARGEPEVSETIGRIRATARARVRQVLEAASADLVIPMDEAVALVYVNVLFAPWQTLTRDLGYSTPEATALVCRWLDRTLFRSNGPTLPA
jgi:AcrR family transcriptional regulator